MGEESLAEGLFPPPPSVLRGALRTRYFTEHPARLREAATETDPTASATITGLALRRGPFTLYPLPRDLVRIQGERRERVRRSRAAEPAEGVLDSSPLPAPLTHPATVQNLADAYLSDDAMARYLSGTDADATFTPVEEDELVTREPKIGIKQSRATRAAEDGHLYRIGFRRLADNVSFAVAVDGLSLEETGLLKLGARDRTAAYETLDRGWPQPEAPVEKIRETGHLKLYLSTPALFEGGWRPSWLDPDSLHAEIGGCRLRLVGAATAKPEPIGGWNMKQNRPRPMRKAVPAGGVYVFSVVSGDPAAAAEAWHGESVSDYRRADGFGLALVGVARPPLPEPSEADS